MNEQEKGIIEDSIKDIKQLTNIAVSLISKANYDTEREYNLNRLVLDIAEDTIGNLIDIKEGKYAEPKEMAKGEER